MIVPQTQTAYPFGASRRDYDRALQAIQTCDLIAEIDAAQWLALDVAGVPGDSRAIAELQLEALIAELERRRALWARSAGDPLRPAWPAHDPDVPARVAAVKAAWPIERFCRELLACDLQPASRDRLKARCPLPGHDDRSPSFVIYPSTNSAWCFGCQRGGDVIKLTGYALGLERFYDRLKRLEREFGIAHHRGAA